jgi:hypothetical protein
MNTRFPLTLAVLCVAAGRASAQVNLLPQGSFESPRVNTEWADYLLLHHFDPAEPLDRLGDAADATRG